MPKEQYPGLVPIGIEYLSEGKVLRRVNERLQEAAKDCVLRPNLVKARTVTITIDVWPEADSDGVLQVISDGKVKTSYPDIKFGMTFSRVDGDQVLVSPYQSHADQLDVEEYENVQKLERSIEQAAE